MKTLIMVLCGFGLLMTGCSGKPHPADSLTVQGTWTGHEGQTRAQGSSSLILDGTNLEFHGADTNEWYKGTYTLREDTSPKQMVIVVTGCAAPQAVGKTAYAIYKIEDGALTITSSRPGNPKVPANFDAPGTRKIVFKK
jgi:uncharacterized protein (TIGR03067 family)